MRVSATDVRPATHRPPPEAVRLALIGVASAAAFNFLVPGMLNELMENSRIIFLVMFPLGLIAGELLLAAVWAVLGPTRFWRRWFGTLAIVLLLHAALVAGMVVDGVSSGFRQFYAVSTLFLPLVFLCSQFPLWLLRLGLGRGLNLENQPSTPRTGSVQFQMRELLTAFALIGIAMAAARLAVLLDDLGGERSDDLSPWLSLATACALFGVWSTLGVVPCVWAAFLATNRRRALFAFVPYVIALVLVAAAAFAATFYGHGRGFQDILTSAVTFHMGLLAIVLGGCHLLRNVGYTIRPNEEPR
jgi:hypothetical protein